MFTCGEIFIISWLYRYLRLIVNCFSHWTFRPIPLPENPCLTSEDVTVIIPTINGNTSQFRETLRSILLTKPHNILLVTIDANLKSLAELARDASSECIQVFSVTHANKRRQMCRAIPEVTTKITVLADDDVTWPPNILHWLLAPLEIADIGGVGPSQRLHRPEKPNLWDFLGAVYLERRNFEMSATTHLDGGISCLSGRTAAYRSQILQDPAFMANFTNEFWRGKYHLNADDDNFITRWLVAHGWRTQIQYSEEAELLTTLEGNPKFLKQCLRWSRSNWRSNLKSMFSEKHIWRQQPWSAYALYLATFTPPSLVTDSGLLYLAYRATEEWNWQAQALAIAALILWMILSKTLKLLGHLCRFPRDFWLLPTSIGFGYFHGLIKCYAFFTLHVTTWGSREGADTDDAYRLIQLHPGEV